MLLPNNQKLMNGSVLGNSVLRKGQIEPNSSANGSLKPMSMSFAPIRTLKYMKALIGKKFIVTCKCEYR